MGDSQKRETRRDRGEEKKIKGLRSYIQPCLVAVSTQTVLAKHLALVAHNVTIWLTNKSLIILTHLYYLRGDRLDQIHAIQICLSKQFLISNSNPVT